MDNTLNRIRTIGKRHGIEKLMYMPNIVEFVTEFGKPETIIPHINDLKNSEKNEIVKHELNMVKELWPYMDEGKDGIQIKKTLASVIFTMSVLENNYFLQNTMISLLQEFKFKNKIL